MTTTPTMRERLARALLLKMCAVSDVPPENVTEDKIREGMPTMLECVDALLAVLAEPSEGMVEAAMNNAGVPGEIDAALMAECECVRDWKAMIAAIQEGA
jgi:hypothetical protein